MTFTPRPVTMIFQPRRFQLAFWIACIAITVLSLLPGEILPPSLFNWWDKAQHALAFAVLCLLGLIAFPSKRWILLLGLIAYGGLIEVAQPITGWRYGDLLDWLADCVGIGIGLALMTAGHRLNPRTAGDK